MNILFLSISPVIHAGGHTISLDLLHALQRMGHEIYIVAGLPKDSGEDTYLTEEAGCQILRVKIGGNKKANPIVKGITTLRLPKLYKKAIQTHFPQVKFDLVLYPTPPITHYETVKFIKKRDGARSYLMLKDIFPQNAVDIGMMQKSGPKGILYKMFRKKEKKLYAISDRIGCMSQANVDYLLKHNPEVDPAKVEICPNAIEVSDMSVDAATRQMLREKYGIPLDKKVFVYGGNLGRPQGIPFLMKCLEEQSKNPDAYFLIVGDGAEYKKLHAWFDEKKPSNMQLLAKLPKADYDKLVAACDVGMIFLDHRFTIPNFPSRLLSYMQAKLPVLCCTDPNTDVGQTCVDGGFGWWCESNDTEAFDRCVTQALKSDLQSMGAKGYAYLDAHYNVTQTANIVLDGLFVK